MNKTCLKKIELQPEVKSQPDELATMSSRRLRILTKMTTGQICGRGYRLVPFTAYEVSCRVRTERCPFRRHQQNSPQIWVLRSLIRIKD
jgi:hypothetical protein